jgi:hypothetical protein
MDNDIHGPVSPSRWNAFVDKIAGAFSGVASCIPSVRQIDAESTDVSDDSPIGEAVRKTGAHESDFRLECCAGMRPGHYFGHKRDDISSLFGLRGCVYVYIHVRLTSIKWSILYQQSLLCFCMWKMCIRLLQAFQGRR